MRIESAQEEAGTQINLFSIAWQSRWLIIACIAFGAVLSWFLFKQATPLYTSTSRIYVERSLPKLSDGDLALAFTANYLNTQAELIRSTPVLSAVVERPEVQELQSIQAEENPVGLLRETVDATVGQDDDIINITAELGNPSDAAVVVNSVVQSYIDKYAEDRRTDLVGVLNILRNEKIRRDEVLEDCRQRLNEFRQEHIALAVEVDNQNVVNQRFGMLARELNQTEIELLQAKSRYDRAKLMLETPSQHSFLLEAAAKESATTRNGDLESRIRELEQSLNEQQARWGDGYPEVKLLKSSLEDLEEQLDEHRQQAIESYVDALRQEYELLQHKFDELQDSYGSQFEIATDVSSQSLQLESLREELVRAEESCDLIDERIKQLNLSEEMGAMNVSVMETAQPGFRSYPSRSKFLGLGIAFGGLIGVGLAWLRDILDHRLRSADDIGEVLRIPVLGTIPHFVRAKNLAAMGQIVADAPRSEMAEAVRTLRTGLHFGMGSDSVKVIAVTSPARGDGRTTVASNLAIALNQVEERVLLIDADMRQPALSEIFDIIPDAGLSDVLAERVAPGEAIRSTRYAHLDFLPCGAVPETPVELLNDRCFSDLLENLSQAYNHIIIDSPPILPTADARVIAAMSDYTLLIVRADATTRRECLAARDELLAVRAQRIGAVVNGVPPRNPSHGLGHTYSDAELERNGSNRHPENDHLASWPGAEGDTRERTRTTATHATGD